VQRSRLTLLLGAALALLTPERATAQTEDPVPPASITSFNARGTFLVNGERFFPIGLTMPPPLRSRTPWGGRALPELVRAGVTLYRTGAYTDRWTDAVLRRTRAWNAAAAARGVYTWVNLRELARAHPGTRNERWLRRVVEALQDSPGMGLWKGVDEPWPGWRPAALANSYNILEELDPGHVVLTVFAPRSRDRTMLAHAPDPPNLRPYSAITDAVGVDVYPIYYRGLGIREPKLHMVGSWTRAIRRATGVNAMTTTLQICFAGSDDPHGSGRYVLPTIRQERYMIYDAIVNGARGLVFYGGELRHCMTDADRRRGWNWTFWRRVLRRLVREIGIRSPLHAALLRPETTTRLRTGDPGTQAISRRVGANDLWVIAVHRGPGAATVSLRGLPAWARSGRAYPGGPIVSARGGILRDHLPGWGVRVYRFRR
jgi:hypothetical protein